MRVETQFSGFDSVFFCCSEQSCVHEVRPKTPILEHFLAQKAVFSAFRGYLNVGKGI